MTDGLVMKPRTIEPLRQLIADQPTLLSLRDKFANGQSPSNQGQGHGGRRSTATQAALSWLACWVLLLFARAWTAPTAPHHPQDVWMRGDAQSESTNDAQDKAQARRTTRAPAGAAAIRSATIAALRDHRPLPINRASAEELRLLPGVGPQIADRIVAYRLRNGPFANVRELQRVRGIGEKTAARLRPWIAFSSRDGPASPVVHPSVVGGAVIATGSEFPTGRKETPRRGR